MVILKRFVLILILLSFGCTNTLHYTVDQNNLGAKIEHANTVVNEYFNDQHLPGMAVSIFMGDAVIWSKGFGYADVAQKFPVDPSTTKFRIGSVSKTLTAAALGDLYEKGILDFDAIVQNYVPDFPVKEYPITVRQVAGHIAGIRHFRGNEFMNTKPHSTIEECLAIFQNEPLLFKPGKYFNYSSYGWILMSAVVEGVSGKEFLGYMKQHVFDPLEMHDTVPEWSNKDIPNLTRFYEGDGYEIAPYVDNSYHWAAGGFVSTTEDLVRFGAAYLNYDFQSEETQQELMTPLTLENGESTNFGIGWITLEHNNQIWVGHAGSHKGGRTMFMINKEHRMVIAFAINRSYVGFDDLHWKLADIFLD